jgi:hypothetical protein
MAKESSAVIIQKRLHDKQKASMARLRFYEVIGAWAIEN